MEREEIAFLFDIYGELLTDNMQNCIDLYYNEDYSLAEIAENLNITRNESSMLQTAFWHLQETILIR